MRLDRLSQQRQILNWIALASLALFAALAVPLVLYLMTLGLTRFSGIAAGMVFLFGLGLLFNRYQLLIDETEAMHAATFDDYISNDR